MQNLQLPVFLSFLTGLLLVRVFKYGKKPPGPFRWPIIGNALQMPSTYPWETFSDWAKTYGDLTYLEVFKRPILVINSLEVANELLVKRSAIYSSRPHLVMAGDLSQFDKLFPLAPYGEEWRAQRRLASYSLSKTMAPKYYSMQEREACKLASKLLKKPRDLFAEVQLSIATITMFITYGYYPQSIHDPFLADMLSNVDNISRAGQPGAWIVDFLPFLKYLPSWIPGTGFLKTAAFFLSQNKRSMWNPYLWCKENLTTGNCHIPNMCSTILAEYSGPLSREEETRVAAAIGATFGAGLHTQASLILSFFLLMSRHPEVQRKAQEELDRVIGTERLPTINDKENLPYVRSVIAEVLRVCPPVPLLVPHSLIEDDVYNEFHLEKDTMILPNVWHMLRDPTAYPSPESFNPDRYNISDVEMNKTTDILFGFGRRRCVGFHVAESALFAFMSTVLATCTVLPTKDEEGKDVIPELRMDSGLVTFPIAFECVTEARSEKAAKLLDLQCNTVVSARS